MEYSQTPGIERVLVESSGQFELSDIVDATWLDASVEQEFAVLGFLVVTLKSELTLRVSSRETVSDISSSDSIDLASEHSDDWDFPGGDFERGCPSRTIAGGN